MLICGLQTVSSHGTRGSQLFAASVLNGDVTTLTYIMPRVQAQRQQIVALRDSILQLESKS